MKTTKIINLTKLGILSIGLFLASCSNEDFDENSEVPDGNEIELVKKSFMGDVVFAEYLGNGEYRLGDVRLFEENFDNDVPYNADPKPEETEKLGLAPGIRKWPDNTIIYVLSGNLTSNQIQVTRESMEEWSSKTNIKFKERTTESFYVTIRSNGDNCNCANASLGVQGTRGTINMGVRTGTGVMTHEIGHTLGYLHEQNRSDRDQFVDIFPENIQDGAISQFRISANSVNPGAFDVKSIMIYSSFTFSKNRQPVMLEKDGTRIPFNGRLSTLDIAGTNVLYPGGTTDPDPDDICDGVDEWVNGQRYQVGDQVTFRGSLYERDFSRWNNLGTCGTDQTSDICEGVTAYNGNNNSYAAGDKVTFQGSLYERLSNGRWRNLGECGN